MNPRIALAVLAAITVLNSPAEARPSTKMYQTVHSTFDVAAVPAYPTAEMPGRVGGRASAQRRNGTMTDANGGPIAGAYQQASYGEGVIGGRPSACYIRIKGRLIPYCGCAVSVEVFGKPIPDLFLAANWKKFPRAMAAAGRVAWRYGHVVLIEQAHGDGTATVYDPNSGGGLTRRHRVSLAPYRIVDPRAHSVADHSGHFL